MQLKKKNVMNLIKCNFYLIINSVKSKSHRHFVWLLLIIITLLVSSKANAILCLLFAVDFLFFLQKDLKSVFNNKLFYVAIGTYILLIVGLINTNNIKQGLFTLEVQASLLLFPLAILALPKLSTNQIYFLLRTFVIIVFITGLYVFIQAMLLHKVEHGYYWPIITVGFTNYDLSRHLNFHPTHLSIYIVFSLALLFFLNKKDNISNATLVIITPFFLIYILFLFSKIAIVICCIILILSIFFFLNIKRLYKVFILAISILIIVLPPFLIPNIKQRIISQFSANSTTTQVNSVEDWSSLNLRMVSWECSYELITQNLLIGVGTGDNRDELNNCYERYPFSNFLFGLDSHNQYLEYFLQLGFLGGLIFCTSLFLPLGLAINGRYYIYLTFLIIIIIVCTTESFLHSQKGVVFYSIFNSIFLKDLICANPK